LTRDLDFGQIADLRTLGCTAFPWLPLLFNEFKFFLKKTQFLLFSFFGEEKGYQIDSLKFHFRAFL
jgi:hypothetical protein